MPEIITPRIITLPDSQTIHIEQPPATYQAAVEFIDVERAGCVEAYNGQTCIDTTGRYRPMTVSDTEGLSNVDNPEFIAELVNVAMVGFNPHDTETRLLLRATLQQSDGQARTIGALTMRYGDLVYKHESWDGPPGGDGQVVAQLHEIDVLPDHLLRRRRIGSAMLSMALDITATHYDPTRSLRLNVSKGNHRAKNWYNKIDVQPTGREKTVTLPSGVKVAFEERSGIIQHTQQLLNRRLE